MLRLLLIVALFAAASTAARAATIRIVAFGDSLTAGYLVPLKDAYPSQLQAALRAKGYDVEVHNAGVSGDTTVGALRRFDLAITPGTDIAIVEFGINDQRMGVPVKTIKARLGEIVSSLSARHIQVLVIGFGRLDLSAVARKTDVPYAPWSLPPGKYRARDGAHYSAKGYSILVKQMLPQVEMLIARLAK